MERRSHGSPAWLRLACVLVCLPFGLRASVAEPPPPAPAAPRPPALRDLSALLEPIRVRHGLPALAGALVVRGQVEAVGAVGVRRLGHAEPVTLEDRWHLGSCTKAMTATLCALLVQDGVLSWERTLGQGFPEWARDEKRMNPAWRGATLEQLLSHRSGVPSDLSADGLWGRLWERKGTPSEQRLTLAAGVLSRPPLTAPGTATLYSNAGVALAGVLAERATKRDFEALLTERLFVPLSMTSAGFGAPGRAVVGAAAADQPRGHGSDGLPVEPGVAADNPPAIAPAGTVHATIGDWAKFVALHLDARHGRSPLLSQKQALHLHTAPKGAGEHALGWLVTDRPWGGTVLHHAGSNTMWYCVTWVAPEKDFAVLVCCNDGRPAASTATDEAAWALIQGHREQSSR